MNNNPKEPNPDATPQRLGKIEPPKIDIRDLPDPFESGYGTESAAAAISDEQLDAMLAGSLGSLSDEPEGEPEPGEKVDGTVLQRRDGEVLVELHHKSHGVIPESEFGEDLPESGDLVRALVVRIDRVRDVVELSVSETRKEVMWEDLHVGAKFEGIVTAANSGGLTLNIKGARAFLPVSHIERHRVEELEPYIGSKLTVEVLSFDRAESDIVVSRRNLLQEQHEAQAANLLEELQEGQVIDGVVKRLNAHGAFIDIGGTDGLLHSSKLARHKEKLHEGDRLRVEISRIDYDRQRITLDFPVEEAGGWQQVSEEYAAGQTLTTLVTEVTAEEARLLIEDDVVGIMPKIAWGDTTPRRGTLMAVEVTHLDSDTKRVFLKPATGR